MARQGSKGAGAEGAGSPFFVRAESDGQAHEILVYDVIGESFWEEGVTAKVIKREVQAVGDADLRVVLNTEGGNHQDGTAIYNILANHAGHVTVSIEGYCCSMGTVIASGADHTESAENAMIMLHKTSTGRHGNADELREAAEMLDRADASMFKALSRKTGKDEGSVKAFVEEKRDTWLTPEEAKAFGLVDEIKQPLKFTACLDKSGASALGETEGAVILGRTKPPAGVLEHLEGFPGALGYRMDGDQVNALLGGQEANGGGSGDGDDDDDLPIAADVALEPAVIAANARKEERERVSGITAQAKALGLDSMVPRLIDGDYDLKTAGQMLTDCKAGIEEGMSASNRRSAPSASGGKGADDWAGIY